MVRWQDADKQMGVRRLQDTCQVSSSLTRHLPGSRKEELASRRLSALSLLATEDLASVGRPAVGQDFVGSRFIWHSVGPSLRLLQQNTENLEIRAWFCSATWGTTFDHFVCHQ